MPPTILYEDDDTLAINKPAGVLVHPVKNKTSDETIVDWLKKYYPPVKSVGDDPANRPGIVHRLDKDTSGVLLIAKNQSAFEYYKYLFQTKKIIKTYLAIVRGVPKKESGIINLPIGIKSGTTKRSVHSTKMQKTATTHYKVIKNIKDKYSLLEVQPQTGRTHQIRVHLASIGHPIIGDSLYNKKPEFDHLLLQAKSLDFTSKSGIKLLVEAPLPDYFLDIH